MDVVKTKVITVAAQLKMPVCGFDFSGCGQSDGHYVSSTFDFEIDNVDFL